MTDKAAGRFAPSPTGDLHLGNLRTALLAWLFARSTGRRFLLRVEDLDRDRARSADGQLADLTALGLDWDGPIVYQSERQQIYDDALARLKSAGLTYECFCSRKDIAEATSAPQQRMPADAPPRAYPGTCRYLTDRERAERRDSGRPAALRLKADVHEATIIDALAGHYTGPVDDVVLRRGDGTVAYNLAVVVDDADQGIDQVVRGDDLTSSTPRQAYLATLLAHTPPHYAHVPLALGPSGARLAKRDGAVTLSDLAARGWSAPRVLGLMASSLGLVEPENDVIPQDLLPVFDPATLPRTPWTVDVAGLG